MTTHSPRAITNTSVKHHIECLHNFVQVSNMKRPSSLSSLFLLVLLNGISPNVLAQTNDDNENSLTHLSLSSNECLKQLAANDPVIVSIAFKDGATGFGQLKELVSRNPWGSITADTQKEIDDQLATQSPFLIITLTKKQALTLDDHRDIIRWTLVQSTTKTCQQ